MSDICLVNIGIQRAWEAKAAPLGILYLAAYLKKYGFKVECKDTRNILFVNSKQYVKDILKYLDSSAQVIGLSCTGLDLHLALQLSKAIKANNPEKIIIIGGAGPFGVEEKILKAFPFIDVIVVGEGEVTLTEIMQHIKEQKVFKDIKGIVYNYNGKIYRNESRGFIKDLDSLPMPAYQSIDMKDYSSQFTIVTQRGCPYCCTFCSAGAFWGHRVRQRNISQVLDELAFLKKTNNIKSVHIIDAVFTLDKKRVIDFCNGLKERKLDIRWFCNGRVGLVDNEMMRKMAQSGCDIISFGVESGSNKVLKDIKKRFTVEQAEADIGRACKIFNSVIALYMWGFPTERMKDLYYTMNSMARLAIQFDNIDIQFAGLFPLPGTSIYNIYADKLKLINDKAHFAFCHSSSIPNFVKFMPDLAKQHPTIFPQFYSLNSPQIIQRRKLVKRYWLQMKKLIGREISLKMKSKAELQRIKNYNIGEQLANIFFNKLKIELNNHNNPINYLRRAYKIISDMLNDNSFG